MTSLSIRQKLIDYIANADEKKVKGLYMLMEDDISGNNEKFDLTSDHLRILNEEREKHINEETQSYTWDDAKKIIRTKKK